MKLDCERASQLLADEEISPDLQDHVRGCFNCSNIASGLTLLDQGLESASRYSPPRDLNELVMFKVSNSRPQTFTPVIEEKALSPHWFRITSLAVVVCLCFSLLDFMRLESNFNDFGKINAAIIALANKNFFDLTQLGVVIAGLLFLGYSNVRKVMVCGVLFFSMFFIEAVRFYFR